MRKGIFFTVDAVFALLALLSIVYLFTLVSMESVSPELMHESLHFQTGDMIGTLAKLRLVDIWNQQEVRELYAAGYINEKDLNNTILEVNGAMWALNETQAVRNLTSTIFSHMVPANMDWAFTIENETLYNTSNLDSQSRIVTVSRRLVSGYMKSKPHVGYTARAFLSNILGRQSSSYLFFGGFVGQGNITGVINDVPSDANVTLLYMEMNIGTNFTLYINNKYCGDFNKSIGNFSVDAWNVTYPRCLGNISRGGSNNFSFNFTGFNFSSQYIGGGYLRVVYDTAKYGDLMTSTQRYYFPGIDGVANLYDSFYVPGTLKNITGYLHLFNNYTTTLTIANKTIYNASGMNTTQDIYFINVNFSSLNYSSISNVTVPLRLLAGANISGGTLGIADVVLITDVSGSMRWDLTSSNNGNDWGNNCNDARMYSDQTTQRLALAKCLDKNFTDIVLSGVGNRLAVVSFNENVTNWTSLTSDGVAIQNAVNNYVAANGTCICCAINKAREILAAQSNSSRLKFIVVMSDGIAGYRCLTTGSCYWWNGVDSNNTYNIYGIDFINWTRGFAVGTGSSPGRIMEWVYRRGTLEWATVSNVADYYLYGVHMYNQTLGFIAGSGGTIMKWTGGGAGSWTRESIAGNPSTTLRSVFVVNRTLAFAVGASGRVYGWNGSDWTLNQTLAGTLYHVEFNWNGSTGFIVGSSGRIYQFNTTTNTWSQLTSPTGQNLREVVFSNRTDYPAYAFGAAGAIIRWDGTSWSSDYNPDATNLYTGFFLNSTRGYAFGDNGRIMRWNGAGWVVDYDPTSDNIYASDFVNSSMAYGVGESGRIINWSIPLWNGTSTIGSQCCSGNTGDCDNMQCEAAVENAKWSSTYAFQNTLNLTVDSIGFGPVANCYNANNTLWGIAINGNGTYYVSDNASQLGWIYRQIGLGILINATIKQEVTVTAGVRTTLYPDSYLEFTFDLSIPPLGYREISVTEETQPMGNCSGNFTIPEWFTPYEARVTSYSSDFWTHNVTVKSSLTGNQWKNVFNLSTYQTAYSQLGDPFNVMFPANLLKPNETNYVNVTTGTNPTNESKECPTANRVIYKARFPASVPFSSIMDYANGSNVTIYYDLDGDGIPDGDQIVLLAYGIEGVKFDSINRNVSGLHPENNAIHDAFIRLLDYINFDKQANPNPPCDDPYLANEERRAGSFCNPIDVELSPDIAFRVSSVTEVPYMWGPVDMGIVTWIKEGG